MDIQEMLFDQN